MKQKTLFIVTAVALVLAFLVGAWFYKSGEADPPARLTERNDAFLVRMHSPTLGKPDAKVQIVEFLDPACGTCAKFYPMVKRILADHPEQIRLVLRWAPFHKGSDAVVAVLEATRKQGKLWPALEALLKSQAQWAPHHTAQVDLVWKHLEGLGLNLDQVRADMMAPEIARVIAQDLGDARALHVTKTPEFFVNGEPLPQFGYGPLITLVNQALASAQR
jgi:protein-disulfide isomerase